MSNVCRALLVLISVAAEFMVGPVPEAHGQTCVTIGVSASGMNMIDRDYSVFALHPPGGAVRAMLLCSSLGAGDPLRYTVTYEAAADASGSINTSSAAKTNFWQYSLPLFGLPLAADMGLGGKAMPGAGNTPQRLTVESSRALSGGGYFWTFSAQGVPITPLDDSRNVNPFPLLHLVARDPDGKILSTSDMVLPVSDEVGCPSCHASRGQLPARPAGGWVNDPNPLRDDRLNILRLHDERRGGSASYVALLGSAGYDAAGLYATVVSGGKPILCARCHASAFLGAAGAAGVPSLTGAMHLRHAGVIDPTTNRSLDAAVDRSACYRCHPGPATRSLRGAMSKTVAGDGTIVVECQSCHGTMRSLGAPSRRGWLDLPTCQGCHTGTAVHNNGQIRYTSAFEASGAPRAAADARFATQPDVPAAGASLYSASVGHGGVACVFCHGPAHAEPPSSEPNDNRRLASLQGHGGVLSECSVCHANTSDFAGQGPHDLHPVGSGANLATHVNAIDPSRCRDCHPNEVDASRCKHCHGADLMGTVLSRTRADRSIATSLGIKRLWAGFQVGCWTCHDGPYRKDAGANRPPLSVGAAATTHPGFPVKLDLVASDPDGDTLVFRIVAQPAHGRVGLAGSRATYFPEPDFVGNDSFTFAASDGKLDSNLATVAISVNASNVRRHLSRR